VAYWTCRQSLCAGNYLQVSLFTLFTNSKFVEVLSLKSNFELIAGHDSVCLRIPTSPKKVLIMFSRIMITQKRPSRDQLTIGWAINYLISKFSVVLDCQLWRALFPPGCSRSCQTTFNAKRIQLSAIHRLLLLISSALLVVFST
jgi:hypothetical protein